MDIIFYDISKTVDRREKTKNVWLLWGIYFLDKSVAYGERIYSLVGLTAYKHEHSQH